MATRDTTIFALLWRRIFKLLQPDGIGIILLIRAMNLILCSSGLTKMTNRLKPSTFLSGVKTELKKVNRFSLLEIPAELKDYILMHNWNSYEIKITSTPYLLKMKATKFIMNYFKNIRNAIQNCRI